MKLLSDQGWPTSMKRALKDEFTIWIQSSNASSAVWCGVRFYKGTRWRMSVSLKNQPGSWPSKQIRKVRRRLKHRKVSKGNGLDLSCPPLMSVAQNLATGNWDLQLSNHWADHLSHGDLIPIHLKDLQGSSRCFVEQCRWPFRAFPIWNIVWLESPIFIHLPQENEPLDFPQSLKMLVQCICHANQKLHFERTEQTTSHRKRQTKKRPQTSVPRASAPMPEGSHREGEIIMSYQFQLYLLYLYYISINIYYDIIATSWHHYFELLIILIRQI